MDAVGDVLEVFGGWREGRQRKVVSVRGWMQSRMFLRFSVLDVDEGRQRKVASVRSGCSRGCFRSFWGMERGTPEEGGIGPGVDAVGDVLEVFGGWREGRQRKVASVRAGTPSGDTTRTP